MQALQDLIAGRDDSIDLDRAALALARIEYPDLELEPSVGLLDSHAAELAKRPGGHSRGWDFIQAANQYLFAELGFTGNVENYYDPRNSCLNDVLMARTGIPITLAVVYIEIARRLDQPVYGVGLPGHFLVGYRDPDFTAYIDVFHGGRLLTPDECFALAARVTGAHIPADRRLLAPVGKRQIVVRMLNNLRGVYLSRRAWTKALPVLNLVLEVAPPSAQDYKERGFVHLQLRNMPAARSDLEAYLRLAPDAGDRADIENKLRSVVQYQAGLN